ncbi:hypothetical protein XI08_09700, partial [Bradyrhizobium sp. CCBAU 11361]|nr:hypothetical protein [Bradyrhizobium sp. CCBAU 11361]
MALGTAWLGERFTWSALTGMTLILAGVIAITIPLPERQRGLEQWRRPRGGLLDRPAGAAVA